MTTYAIGPGVKQTVTERGWGARKNGFTACRFAVEAQICLRMGYQVPVGPNDPNNFVFALQAAGDNTPKDGSTLRQGQKAIATLIPGAPMLFGTLTDQELIDAVNKGATVGFAVDCGKLPRYLKNDIGYGYNGGHYMAVDGFTVDGTGSTYCDLSDPMYRPAWAAKPRRVVWTDVSQAIIRNAQGAAIVCLGFDSAAYLPQELAQAEADLATGQAAVTDAQSRISSLNAQIAAQAI